MQNKSQVTDLYTIPTKKKYLGTKSMNIVDHLAAEQPEIFSKKVMKTRTKTWLNVGHKLTLWQETHLQMNANVVCTC